MNRLLLSVLNLLADEGAGDTNKGGGMPSLSLIHI